MVKKMASASLGCTQLLLAGLFCLGCSFETSWAAMDCDKSNGCDAKSASALLQVHKSSTKQTPALKVRFDQSCWYAGNDMASRDASCSGTLVCAKKGDDGRDFGDCPGHHCCSVLVEINTKDRFDATCYAAGSDMASRDASCKGDLVCARPSFDNRNFGDCPAHCCSLQVGVKERFDSTCWEAGDDMATRDASCKEGLLCAQKGQEHRDFGDCPGKHCCSVITNTLERFDTSCYMVGSDMESRDAACKGDLVCAKRGFDYRNFGDCAEHCCSLQVGVKERFDKTCWHAGRDMASRDASCKEGLVCAQKGHENRSFGDCPGEHCCSMIVRARYDMSCWAAGSDVASRDAACKGDLVCARRGYDNRDFGDCPNGHCCSMPVGIYERFDKTCWKIHANMAARDASCKKGFACAMKGRENRTFGDCPGEHCCSLIVRKRYDTSCWEAGADMASRDASCEGDLVCARNGYDNRNFGDCPGGHCCSIQMGVKERFDKTCWKAGLDMEARDASCKEGFVCAMRGRENRNFGDCPNEHCCSLIVRDRYDMSCWEAGSDTASRDAACKGNLVCARNGYDNRNFGDCPNGHCCSAQVGVLDRFAECYGRGSDAASRDAACKEGLVCARRGKDGRGFGDCPGKYCCSTRKGILDLYDTTCHDAGTDMASRDAACKGDLVCARQGYDNRNLGDCAQGHCCSAPQRYHIYDRGDRSCWNAGQDVASRDASCKQGLVCAMKGYDGRDFGDCPDAYCCSFKPSQDGPPTYTARRRTPADEHIARRRRAVLAPSRSRRPRPNPNPNGRAIYGVGGNGRIYKQDLGNMMSSWRLTGAGSMQAIALDGNFIFGVGTNNKLYKQALGVMSPTSSWKLVAAGDVQSIAIDGETIYAVGTNKRIFKQSRSRMTRDSAWLFAGEGTVTSIAISGGVIYATGTDHKVYKQALSGLNEGSWTLAGGGDVSSIAIDDDTIYGATENHKLYKQVLSTMTPSTAWQLTATGDIKAVDVTAQADPGRI